MVRYIVIQERPPKGGEEVFFDAYSLKQYLIDLDMDFISIPTEGISLPVDDKSLSKGIKQAREFKLPVHLFDVNHEYSYVLTVKEDKTDKGKGKKDKGKGKAKVTKNKKGELSLDQLLNLAHQMHLDGNLHENTIEVISDLLNRNDIIELREYLTITLTPWLEYYKFDGDRPYYVEPPAGDPSEYQPSYTGGGSRGYSPRQPSYTRAVPMWPSDDEIERDELEDEEEFLEMGEGETRRGTRPRIENLIPEEELNAIINEADRLARRGELEHPLVEELTRMERLMRHIMPPTDPTELTEEQRQRQRQTVNVKMPNFKSKL